MFRKSANPRKLFQQDGDTSQNSVKARSVLDEVVGQKCTILARSKPYREHLSNCQAEVTPIAALPARDKTMLELIPVDVVGRTILSLGIRINEIIKQKRQRVKY